MDCEEFNRNWQGFLADVLDSSTQSAMVVHAKTCDVCGPRWFGRQELDTTLGAVLEAHRLPKEMADNIAKDAFQEHFGAAVAPEAEYSAATIPTAEHVESKLEYVDTTDSINEPQTMTGPFKQNSQQSTIMFIIAAIAGVVGYVLGGSGAGGNSMQRMLNMQMMYGGRGMSNAYEAMMISELMGSGGGAGRGILPTMTSTVHVICLAILLIWVTRNRVWHYLFPARLPFGIQVAKWLALITALIGLARCLCFMLVSLFMFNQMQRGSGDMSWIASSVGFVNQLWSIAFWITLLVIVLTCVDQYLKSTFPVPAKNK